MAVIEYMIQGYGRAADTSCCDVWSVSAFDGYMAQFVDFSEFESGKATDTGT